MHRITNIIGKAGALGWAFALTLFLSGLPARAPGQVKAVTSAFEGEKLSPWRKSLDNLHALTAWDYLQLRADTAARTALETAANRLADEHGFLVFEYAPYALLGADRPGEIPFLEEIGPLVRDKLGYGGPYLLLVPYYERQNEAFHFFLSIDWTGYSEIDAYSENERNRIEEVVKLEALRYWDRYATGRFVAEAKAVQKLDLELSKGPSPIELGGVNFLAEGYSVFSVDNGSGSFEDLIPYAEQVETPSSGRLHWAPARAEEENDILVIPQDSKVYLNPKFVPADPDMVPDNIEVEVRARSFGRENFAVLKNMNARLVKKGDYYQVHNEDFENFFFRLPRGVNYYEELVIFWKYRSTENHSDQHILVSVHKVFATLEKALRSSKAVYCLYFGCVHGQNALDQTEWLNKVWSKFNARYLTPRDFNFEHPAGVLTYYKNPEPTFRTKDILTTVQLSNDYGEVNLDGECTAFADVFKGILDVQGIWGRRAIITSIQTVGFGQESIEYFLVRNWEHVGYNNIIGPNKYYYQQMNIPNQIREETEITTEDVVYTRIVGDNRDYVNQERSYGWIGAPDLIDIEGVPSQGNSTPYSDFGSHWVVNIASQSDIFDASYGKRHKNLKEWEEKSIEAFYKQSPIPLDENLYGDINQNGEIEEKIDWLIWEIRKNPANNDDTKLELLDGN